MSERGRTRAVCSLRLATGGEAKDKTKDKKKQASNCKNKSKRKTKGWMEEMG